MGTPALTPRQRQILDFVASFVAGEGYLPSTRQISAACGLRSPTSARRALRVLEDHGYLVRDPDHARLATVSVPDEGPDGADLDEELGLCELIMGEMEGAAEAANDAATLVAQLSSDITWDTRVWDTLVGPPVNFTKQPPEIAETGGLIASIPRVFTTSVYYARVKNGKLKAVDNEAHNFLAG